MSTRKKPVPAPVAAPSTWIQNCTITNTSAANEHTRAAIEALAAAAKANAEAISAIANGLKGSPATMDYGIFLGSPK
jgi:hypothetical protein